MARALRPQVGEDRLDDPHGAVEVRLHLAAQLRLGQLLDRPDLRVPGVVDDHVEAAEVRDGRFDGRVHRGLVGDVHGERQDRVAVLLDQLAETLSAPRGGGDAVAAAEGRFGELPAEAAGRTGDEPDLAHDDVPLRCVRGAGPGGVSPGPRGGTRPGP
nr:hypothetical protein GCM10025732_27260 [Glycomyces mayteni]